MALVSSRDTGFRDRAVNLLAQVLSMTREAPGLQEMHAWADDAREGLGGPMRVAIMGQIKKGKSTLVNALLAEHIVPTGTLETSFNANELYWAPDPSLTVHYKDGRPPELKPSAELEALTVRDAASLALLRQIDRIEIGHPNDLLRTFHLIDTPGLNSVYQHDEENALRMIGRTREEVDEISTAHLAHADAIVFLFSRGLAAQSGQLVAELHGPVTSSASPLRAVGVLSKCDEYWLSEAQPGLRSADTSDPLAIGKSICDRYLAEPRIARLFYSIVPVAGILASGAADLTADDIGYLTVLATITPERRLKELRDIDEFASSEESATGLPPSVRRRLVGLLGGYGVSVACDLVGAGSDDHQLRAGLVAASGLADLKALLISHFGNRSVVIKVDTMLRQLDAAIAMAREAGSAGAVDEVADLAQVFRTSEAALAEVRVLAAHYRAQLGLSPAEAEELLAITGEHGTSAAARLRLPSGTPAAELEDSARKQAQAWRKAADEPTKRGRRSAMRTVARSYEQLADDIESARALLGLA
jgi:Dynamin family